MPLNELLDFRWDHHGESLKLEAVPPLLKRHLRPNWGNTHRSVPVASSQGVVMYHLVYASRDPLGDRTWDSVTAPRDQRELRLQ